MREAIARTRVALADHWRGLLASRTLGDPEATGSVTDVTTRAALDAALDAALWEPYAHPAVESGCAAFWTRSVVGRMGIVELDALPPDAPVALRDAHATGYVEVEVEGDHGDPADGVCMIVGDENGEEVVFTFHPGVPIAPSRLRDSAVPSRLRGRPMAAADAFALGFRWAKVRRAADAFAGPARRHAAARRDTFSRMIDPQDIPDSCPVGEEPRFEFGLPARRPDTFTFLPGFEFFLGTHKADWLAHSPVPLFLSRRSLVLDAAKKGTTESEWAQLDRQRKTLPRALVPWALDSAGFTELNQFGCHHIPPAQYAAEVVRYQREIGNLRWAAVQDHMCEEHVLAITGRDVRYHQERTIASLIELRSIAPEVPWAPVLQGFHPGEHRLHLTMYYANGFDLRAEQVVPVGSVCRRQGMVEADDIVRDLSAHDLKLHVLGYKFTGLPAVLRASVSGDSLAWSKHAFHCKIRLPGHTHSVCNNCLDYALLWREGMLRRAAAEAHPDLVARHYGNRALSPEERAQFEAWDPTETYQIPQATVGDYELARQAMTRLSGVRVPRSPVKVPLPRGLPTIAPAVYRAPSEPAPVWPRAPRAHLVGLPSSPASEPRDFLAWQPGGGLFDARRAPFDGAAVDALAIDAAADVFNPGDIAETYPVESPELAFDFATRRIDDRLPSSAAFQRFLIGLRSLPREGAGRLAARFRRGFEAELWRLHQAQVGDTGNEQPSVSPHHWHSTLPA